jgi:hypothetical protein
VFSFFSTYSPPELRHLSYRGTNVCILCRRSLPPGIGTTVFWCQVLRANFVQQGAGNLWEMTAEFRNCENMLCAFRNFITDRTSQSAGAGIFNSCNAATVRTQEVPLVHAPCYSIALSRMRSRFAQYKVANCGTSGKLILWTRYISLKIRFLVITYSKLPSCFTITFLSSILKTFRRSDSVSIFKWAQ